MDQRIYSLDKVFSPQRMDGELKLAVSEDLEEVTTWISALYTPKEHRRQGFASRCVAALSAQLLKQGYRFCFLYTDLANPTSNSIYQKIGYRAVCDSQQYRFIRR